MMQAKFTQRFSVPFEYPVYFTNHAFASDNHALRDSIARPEKRQHRVFAVVDDGLARAWPRLCEGIESYVDAHSSVLTLVKEPQVVPSGEECKNSPDLVNEMHRALYDLRMDRHSVVLIVGGGALQDAVGYAAATAHRGIRVVRMPTTVLSQNDSGVGVKNGINTFGSKNFLGTFAPPHAVVNDLDLLQTLSERDKRAGLAEAVKVALIRDPIFFDWLEAHADALNAFEAEATAGMVQRSAELHLQHIASGGDPFESGSARPLDYGHWAAHKLESLTDHALRHGEAVAIGMALDGHYGVLEGLLSEADLERAVGLLRRLGLPLWDDALAERDDQGRLSVLGGIDDFREHLGGDLTLCMLEGIGQSTNIHEVDTARVEQAIERLRERG